MKLAFLIGVGSFLGGISRYLLTLLIDEKFFHSTTLGTFAVNIIGCFLIGIVFAVSDKGSISQEWRFFLASGLLGGFTTFSAFSYQNISLLQNGRVAQAALYITSSVLLGLAATYAAILLFKSNI